MSAVEWIWKTISLESVSGQLSAITKSRQQIITCCSLTALILFSIKFWISLTVPFHRNLYLLALYSSTWSSSDRQSFWKSVGDFKQVAGPEQSWLRPHATTTTQEAVWLFHCFLPLALLYNSPCFSRFPFLEPPPPHPSYSLFSTTPTTLSSPIFKGNFLQ